MITVFVIPNPSTITDSMIVMSGCSLFVFAFTLANLRFDPSVDFSGNFIAALVLVVAGNTLVSYFVSSLVVDRILNPVRGMIGKVREIGERRFTNALLVIDSEEDELVDYAVAFNEMTLKLGDYIEKQKRFVSDASHELSTPITIINGHADMLLRWGKDDPAMLDEGLAVIRGEALRMNELVENLLFFARSDSDRQEYSFALEDINALINDCADEARKLYPSCEITLVADVLPKRRCDADALRRVLRILFDNAVKHGGGGTAALSVKLSPEGRIILKLADNGPGIPEKHLEEIFDRFFRLDESRVKKTGGSGLGLAIAKEIVERHGGTIRAENNSGAVFVVEL